MLIKIEGVCFWFTVALYVIASFYYLWELFIKRSHNFRIALWLSGFGFLFHTVAVLSRWIYLGYPPGRKDYEQGLLGSWLIVFIFLLIQVQWGEARPLGVLVLPVTFLTLGYGALRGPREPTPVTPPYKSLWLFVHLFFAWIAIGVFTVSFASAIFYLLKEGGKKGGLLERVPSKEELDDLMFRLNAFGFIAEAVMIASGAIWANLLWGKYWSWDPVETWSLIAWVIYGLYLHLRLTRGWKGKGLAWITIIGYVAVNISTWGVQVLPTTWHLFRLF